jgi:hypothetical protein
MTREQFLSALAILTQRYEETGGAVGISQEEATALLELYDAGEINPRQLPLPFEEATRGPITQLTLERAAERVAAEATSMAVIERTGVVPAIAFNAPQARRTRIAQQSMELFDEEVRGFAREIFERDMRPRDWHSKMIVRLRQHLLQQAQLGKGEPLTPQELSALQETMTEQSEYLKRFADEVAVRNELADSAETVAERRLTKEAREEARERLAREAGEEVSDISLSAADEAAEEPSEEAIEELAEELRGRPMTEDEIAARARQYKGASYRAFWEKAEESATEGRTDMIVRYHALDDSATCTACQTAEANSPYLAGSDHPYPGSVCLGGGHCRCSLDFQQAPEIADSLR